MEGAPSKSPIQQPLLGRATGEDRVEWKLVGWPDIGDKERSISHYLQRVFLGLGRMG